MSDRFLNPYNFIRPLPRPKAANLETGLLPPDAPIEQHLLWRCPPPPHDRYTGLSGTIHCRMKAETPIFVSDSEITAYDKDKDHKTYQFFNVDGQDMIPASSLRGAIRSIFEAATNSTLGVFASDNPLFYRMEPTKALGLVPALVMQDAQGNFGLALLNGMDRIEIGSKNLYAAWIPRYPNKPRLKHRDERKHRHVLSDSELVPIPKTALQGRQMWAAVRPTDNRGRGFPHQQADFIDISRDEVEAFARRNRDMRYSVVQGFAYVTGLNADVKQYERFFFIRQNAEPQLVPLRPKVVETYNLLMADYHKRAEEIENSLTSQSKDSGRDIKPSHFIQAKDPWRATEGRLVYAQLREGKRGYIVEGIYPVAIPRTAYAYSPADLLERQTPHLLPAQDFEALCLASRLFGWVSQEDENSANADKSKRVAYKGRLRFTHARPDLATLHKMPLQTLAILGTPNPTSIEFYLRGVKNLAPKRDAGHGYDEAEAQLRGRKVYRHHGSSQIKQVEAGKFNRTIEGAHDRGTAYDFEVHFENLQPLELGALLWTLELGFSSGQGCHRLGYAKSFGLGSATISIKDVRLRDAFQRYRVDAPGHHTPMELPADNLRLVEMQGLFQQTMADLYGQDFHQLDNIRDLEALLAAPPSGLEITYPGQWLDHPFEWFMVNKKSERPQILAPAAEDRGLKR